MYIYIYILYLANKVFCFFALLYEFPPFPPFPSLWEDLDALPWEDLDDGRSVAPMKRLAWSLLAMYPKAFHHAVPCVPCHHATYMGVFCTAWL